MSALPRLLSVVSPLALLATSSAYAEVKIATERVERARFKDVPAPSSTDAASQAKLSLVAGEKDRNGGDLARLTDGRMPRGDYSPSENFFFAAGTDGGRIVVELKEPVEISEINTFSFHRETRGPQVYRVFGSLESDANAALGKEIDPTTLGWKLMAAVDTRPQDGGFGGAYGVSISDTTGKIGRYRYLLFDFSRTEDIDPFGNTFYSEIDIVDAAAPKVTRQEEPAAEPKVLEAEGGKYRFVLDATEAPDLAEWVERELGPVVQKWYPLIVEMLPSAGFDAPNRVVINFQSDLGGTPAAAAGNRVMCNIEWFRKNLQGEARGAVVHELVHVVQQYGRGRRGNRDAKPTPGWIQEGIPDYIRWFLYEPETRGAEITRGNIGRARYDSSYRVTGNFLDWVVKTHGKEIIPKVNAAAREGKYEDAIWKELTGKTVQELGDEWRKQHEERLGITAAGGVQGAPL